MEYDLVVIGGGAAGLSAARTAVGGGARALLVSEGPLGGDCTWVGCVPSKTLIAAAARSASFEEAMAAVHRAVAEIALTEDEGVLRREGVDVLRGRAAFTAPGHLEVDGRGITGRRFVIATGTEPFVPLVEGLDDVEVLTNENVFDLDDRPGTLAVLGGGAVGCELAQAFRRLGSAVTVVEGAPTLLGREEPEAQEAVSGVLQREGVTVRTGATAVRVDAGPVLHLDDGTTIAGSHLLVAVGRTPSTDGLGLETAGVRLEKRRIVTDEHLRAADTVWAAGDCTSTLQFTHVGDEQGRLAARNAFAGALPWKRGTWDDRVVPWVTFTEPEVGHVGLTEAQAHASYGDRAMVSTAWERHGDRARTAGETEGFVKLIALPGKIGGMLTGKLLGMTAVGPMAGELIAEGALSMRTGSLVGRMAQTIHAYPTWSLTTRYAAAGFFDRGREPARQARA